MIRTSHVKMCPSEVTNGILLTIFMVLCCVTIPSGYCNLSIFIVEVYLFALFYFHYFFD